jgi:aminopeptidase N
MPDAVYLKDYKPYPYALDKVSLEFVIHEDATYVSSTLNFTKLNPEPLVLYGIDLELIQVKLDGQDYKDYDLKDGNLVIHVTNLKFTLDIQTKIYPHNNTELSGLYYSHGLFSTQCEAEGFRRITFFPDRPDVLTLYTTKIIADVDLCPILLSNGNLLEAGRLDNNRHFVIWQDPFKKPSYLFALVAGSLNLLKDTFITQSKRVIDLYIYTDYEDVSCCAHAMHSLKNAMRWDEENYGLEYDLDIFMIVAVRDFNMGAMENKGLNIFNAKYILASRASATDHDYIAIESVVAHEYFHNWTGNRVTCRDWFQLSLKEGLTVFRDESFSCDMQDKDVMRLEQVKIMRSQQFPEDRGSMAHPVRPSSYESIDNFYTATVYNKGAEVIRMQQTLLGKAGFRAGMDLYFSRHDGAAVTIDDFVQAMMDANGYDLTQFKLWYSQAGTPVLEIAESFVNNEMIISIKQSCRATPETPVKQPFHIPLAIGIFSATGEVLGASQLLELKKFDEAFNLGKFPVRPVISYLQGFSAPVIVHKSPSIAEDIIILQAEQDGVAKLDAAIRLSTRSMIDNGKVLALENIAISAEVLAAFRKVLLDHSLDYGLRAEILMPPSFEDLALTMSIINPVHIDLAREKFCQILGQALQQELQDTYDKLWRDEDHAMTAQAFNRRSLRNTCLSFLQKSKIEHGLESCYEQFMSARTMTDKLTSFELLVNSDNNKLRDFAVKEFYHTWSHDELVLQKWFAVQARAKHEKTLQRVQKLLKHEKFIFSNPNMLRSLIGTFCQANPRNFYAADNSGYKFLTKMLLKIDKINSQISARLATPFTRTSHLEDSFKQAIHHELEFLMTQKLSKNLNEIIGKSLE